MMILGILIKKVTHYMNYKNHLLLKWSQNKQIPFIKTIISSYHKKKSASDLKSIPNRSYDNNFKYFLVGNKKLI